MEDMKALQHTYYDFWWTFLHPEGSEAYFNKPDTDSLLDCLVYADTGLLNNIQQITNTIMVRAWAHAWDRRR